LKGVVSEGPPAVYSPGHMRKKKVIQIMLVMDELATELESSAYKTW
jgi:hypothetical protein